MKRPQISVPMAAVLVWFFSLLVSPVQAQTRKDSTVKEAVLEHGCDFDPYLPNFNEFLRANLKYPEKARKDGIHGFVMIKFYVEADGSLSNFQIEKSLSPECDAEVIRVFKLMPRWVPHEFDGKHLRVAMISSVKFDPEK